LFLLLNTIIQMAVPFREDMFIEVRNMLILKGFIFSRTIAAGLLELLTALASWLIMAIFQATGFLLEKTLTKIFTSLILVAIFTKLLGARLSARKIFQ